MDESIYRVGSREIAGNTINDRPPVCFISSPVFSHPRQFASAPNPISSSMSSSPTIYMPLVCFALLTSTSFSAAHRRLMPSILSSSNGSNSASLMSFACLAINPSFLLNGFMYGFSFNSSIVPAMAVIMIIFRCISALAYAITVPLSRS